MLHIFEMNAGIQYPIAIFISALILEHVLSSSYEN